MANALNLNFLPQKLEGERQWVVRASSGTFVRHFLQYGVIAIGHLNDIDDKEDIKVLTIPDLKKILYKPDINNDFPPQSTITNHANQAASFLHEMQPGDLVITLDDQRVAIGRIKSAAFFAPDPLNIVVGKRIHPMPYKIRRWVAWGPSFNRAELPLNVEYTLRAHQTVFNIDKHWEFLYHLIYPVFADSGNLYFSSNIRQRKDIDSYSVSQLLGYFSDFEAIFKGFDPDNISDRASLAKLINDFRKYENHELICRAQFFSEGPVWWKLPVEWLNDYRKFIVLIVFLEITFGGDFGFMSFPGIITPEMRNVVTEYILEAYKTRNIEEVIKELKLTIPKHDTLPLEQYDTTIEV